MVKVERTPLAPASLAIEKLKVNGSYNKPDVVSQLRHDFNDKCYICELKNLHDPEVEHLIPHDNGRFIDLKFDWNNLFWSCRHCNGVKNKRIYDRKIIDCTIEDPENHLALFLRGDEVEVRPVDDEEESLMTAQLIQETFNQKNTGIRIAASEVRLKELKKEMSKLYKALQRFIRKPELPQSRVMIRALLSKQTAFAGFKRSYIRSNISNYPELDEFVN